MSDSIDQLEQEAKRLADEYANAKVRGGTVGSLAALESVHAAISRLASAARAQRVEMSDERIREIGGDIFGIDLAMDGRLVQFARAVLAAAGASEQDRVDAGSKTADGDYARMAEKCGAAVNWDGGGLYFKASAWGRFCDILREQSEGEKE